MWIIRVSHPVLISRIIIIMVLKAVSVCAVYSIERINPEIICSNKTIPSRNPMFHIYEIEDGEGRSRSEFFIIFKIGFVFVSLIFIKRKKKLFGWGGVH